MPDIRIPYGPRRSDLAAIIGKRNKRMKASKRIDANQTRDALLDELEMKIEPVEMEAG